MKHHFFLACILFASCLSVSGQTDAPQDANNDDLLAAQRQTANKFMHALEKGEIDKAFGMIEPKWSARSGTYKDSLKAYAAELAKYKNMTTFSVVTVWPRTRFNTYRCRYYNTKGDFFYMDLDLSTGNPTSSIQRIVKISEAELRKERRELAQEIKKQQIDTIPPPLPPPPGPIPHH